MGEGYLIAGVEWGWDNFWLCRNVDNRSLMSSSTLNEGMRDSLFPNDRHRSERSLLPPGRVASSAVNILRSCFQKGRWKSWSRNFSFFLSFSFWVN